MTNVTDRGGGYGGGWRESQDEFKRRVMEKTKAFLCIASCVAFVVLSVDQSYKNQQIQSPTPQQQQASVQRAQIAANTDSNFDWDKKFLEKPLVKCIIADTINYYLMENYKSSEGWQCAMNALQNQSRSYQ